MSQPPDHMVVMGRIAIPYGVLGWVKIQSFTEYLDSLLDYPDWWLGKAGQWRGCEVEEARIHGKTLIVKFAGCNDRTAAFALKGLDIAVKREELPPPQEGEYYWSDLVGLKVSNLQQQPFGTVKEVFETGANDVLVVQGEDRERLIPFTDDAVQQVDIAAGTILVDWDADF